MGQCYNPCEVIMEENKNTSGSRNNIFLAIISMIAGILAGFLGYLLGQYFYILFVFPFILLAIGFIFFIPAVLFFKNINLRWMMLCAVVMGLLTLVTFHYTEYMVFRNKAVQSAQISQNLSERNAALTVDKFLKSKVGASGFLGFLKYQDSQLRPYIFYTTKGSELTNTIVFFLHGRNGWLYLAGEAAILLGGSLLIAFFTGKRIQQRVQ